MFKKNLIILFSSAIFFTSFQNTSAQKQRPRSIKRKEIVTVTVKAQPEPEVSTKNLSDEQKLRLETFRTVWKIIDEYYFDQTFNGLNWHKLKYENELRVVNLKTDAQLYNLLNDLVSRLDASHFAIIPPEYLQEIQKIKTESESRESKDKTDDPAEVKSGKDDEISDEETDEFLKSIEEYNSRYGIGADIKLFGQEVVITHLDKDSAAEKAGLKTGFVIKTVNGISLADFIARLQKFDSYERKLKNQMPIYIETFLLNGDKDSSISVGYDDGSGQTKEIAIKRERLDGEMIKIMANMPRQFLQFEQRPINDETGYVRFNIFTVATVEKLCSAISEFKDKKSLIIDLRGNIGGSFGALFGIVGLLVQKDFFLGTEISVSEETPRFIKPHVKNFKGKIVVLVDNSSLSAAEIFSAGLQESGRAVIIGETSGGEALPSIMTLLPTGAVFQYPVSNYKTAKGKVLEGNGVKPDVQVFLNKSQLLAGKDNQLEAAVEYLKKDQSVIAKVETPITVQVAEQPPPPPKPIATKSKPAFIKEQYDQNAVEIIEKYLTAIGGAENLKKIETLVSEGDAVITRAGAKVSGDFRQLRSSQSKDSEIYTFDGVGDVSEIFDGEKYFLQTQVNGIQELNLPVKLAELKLENDFQELINLKTNYKQVKFLGNFERSEKRVNLIQVTTDKGNGFVLAFDVKTNLLVHRSGNATDVSYDDYKKVGEYLFPFKISKAGMVEIVFNEILVNEKIDDSSFSRKTSCFDKVD